MLVRNDWYVEPLEEGGRMAVSQILSTDEALAGALYVCRIVVCGIRTSQHAIIDIVAAFGIDIGVRMSSLLPHALEIDILGT